MDVNEKQIGGTHYVADYQHWDFVSECKINYLIGCATKYVFRWRKKNGVEDLRKAIHYLEKAESCGEVRNYFKKPLISFKSSNVASKFARLVGKSNGEDILIMSNILSGDFKFAIRTMEIIIRTAPAANFTRG